MLRVVLASCAPEWVAVRQGGDARCRAATRPQRPQRPAQVCRHCHSHDGTRWLLASGTCLTADGKRVGGVAMEKNATGQSLGRG